MPIIVICFKGIKVIISEKKDNNCYSVFRPGYEADNFFLTKLNITNIEKVCLYMKKMS